MNWIEIANRHIKVPSIGSFQSNFGVAPFICNYLYKILHSAKGYVINGNQSSC